MPANATKRVVKKSPRRVATAAELAPASPVDRLLAASGVAIACSTLAFAGYMVADTSRQPRIAGIEYLSIFARPSHSPVIAAQREAPVVAEASNQPAAPSIDPTPTGSILERAASGQPVNLILTPIRDVASMAPSSPYKILDVSRGEALIASQIGSRRVRAGDIVPELGRVDAIERRGDHWVLLTQHGVALTWPAPPPPPVGLAAPGKSTSPR